MKKMLTLGTAALLMLAVVAPTSMATESNDYQSMYDEERTALVTYQKVIEQFGEKRPFSNIIKAEEKHAEKVKELAESKDVKVVDNTITVSDFESYDAAVDRAIAIEKEDIEMLKELLKNKDLDADAKLVYERLLNGSENHLVAFERASKGEIGSQGMNSKEDGSGKRQRNRKNDGAGRHEDCVLDGEGQMEKNGLGKGQKNAFGKSDEKTKGNSEFGQKRGLGLGREDAFGRNKGQQEGKGNRQGNQMKNGGRFGTCNK